jgi:DoxX-like family
MRDVNIVLSVLQGLLAAFFLAAGVFHLLMLLPRLKASAPWTEDVGGPRTRMIGLLEMLAAIGLVLPSITHIATVRIPLPPWASCSSFSAPSHSTWAVARSR